MAVSMDNSSGAFLSNINMTPSGFEDGAWNATYRGIGSSWFNAENVAAEDWQRNEQAANNQFYRDMAMQSFIQDFNASEAQKARDFNASEAQKGRDFSERMSNTAYQRAMADMKKAGLNPILAYSAGGSSSPSASIASSSSASSSGGVGSSSNRSSNQDGSSSFVGALVGIAKIIAGVYTSNASSVASGFTDVIRSSDGVTTKTRTYNK